MTDEQTEGAIRTEDGGIPIPAELHDRWRQVRAQHNTVVMMSEALAQKQMSFSDYQAKTWDDTAEALGLDPHTQWAVNYTLMKLYKVGSMPLPNSTKK